MSTKNPWLGLAPYEEPKSDGDNHLFCGRDEETLEVVRLIDNNLFITLYGCSGIGKTSLLRAGVIPILKRKGYFPLYVRLSQEPKDITFAEAIIRKLQKNGLTEERIAEMKHTDPDDRLYLWEYFATTRFMKDGREVYPVVILDQFEEVFRKGKKAKAERLLQQIYLLLNDELEMSDEAGWSSDTNYRFVASIREDYLFVLEDSIDEYSLDLYKNNRYRLRPMKPEQARKVVMVPGKDCIEKTEMDAVVERIITLAKRPQTNEIDTLLLSLVCSGTYDKKMGEKITVADLEVWNDNPMEVYYRDAVNGLTTQQIRYIQQHFIREDGSRRRVDAAEATEALGESTYRQLTRGKNRLLAVGDNGKVELLHDQLGMAVYEERKAFEERERKKMLIRRAMLVSLVAVLIAGFFLYQNHTLKQQRAELNKQKNRTEALLLGSTKKTANDLADEGNSYMAMRLLLNPINQDALNENAIKNNEANLIRIFSHNTAILRGHAAPVYSAAFSPDGKYIVTASEDSTIRIWNARDGSLDSLVSLKHMAPVYSAAFSPDGERIVSVSSDSTLSVWNAKDGHLWGSKKNKATVNSAAFDPNNGNRIISALENNTITIWDIQKDSVWSLPKKHSAAVNSATFSHNGKYIVSASKNEIILWDAQNGSMINDKIGAIKSTKKNFYSATFSPDDKYIIFISDGIIRIWDLVNKQELTNKNIEDGFKPSAMGKDGKKENKKATYKLIDISPDGKSIVFASPNNTVKIWDVEDDTLKTLEGHNGRIYSVAFSPKKHETPDDPKGGRYIVTASEDKTVRIWDIGEKPLVLRGHTSQVTSATFSPSGDRIVSASDDSTVRIWDAKNGSLLYTLKDSSYINSASYSPDGEKIVAASDSLVIIWDIESQSRKTLSGHTSRVWSAAFSPNDGNRIVSASEDSTILIWDVKSNAPLDTLRCNAPVSSAAFSRNGTQVIAASNEVIIWNIEKNTSNHLKTLEESFRSADISPDGKYIVTTSPWWYTSDNEVIQVRTTIDFSKTKTRLKGHTAPVYYAAFSPDGKYIVTASEDKTIKIWSVETGLELQTFEGHTKKVAYAAFSPDGRRIVSASYDYTVRIWELPPLQELIDQARERFKDYPLTQEERVKYYLE